MILNEKNKEFFDVRLRKLLFQLLHDFQLQIRNSNNSLSEISDAVFEIKAKVEIPVQSTCSSSGV